MLMTTGERDDRPVPERRMSRVETWIVVALLILACLQCTRAIFFQNVSWVDLHLYAEGRERMPFQGRVAMMPLLRAAGESRYMGLIAAAIDREARHQVGRRGLECAEPFSPEKLASLLAGTLCTLLAVAILFARGRSFGALQWLPAVIFLGVLYASYAARYEEAYWYPYDLPHMLIFGAACLCLLDGPLWMFFPLFVLDLPMRETSVFLIVVAVPVLVRRWRLPKAMPALAVMAALWLAVHLAITRAFAQNASETGSRLTLNLKNLALPLHWPQMASALGFLLIPVLLGRARLPDRYRWFLYWMLPCLLVTAWFGMLIESRIYLEWTMPIAYLASLELMNFIHSETPICAEATSLAEKRGAFGGVI